MEQAPSPKATLTFSDDKGREEQTAAGYSVLITSDAADMKKEKKKQEGDVGDLLVARNDSAVMQIRPTSYGDEEEGEKKRNALPSTSDANAGNSVGRASRVPSAGVYANTTITSAATRTSAAAGPSPPLPHHTTSANAHATSLLPSALPPYSLSPRRAGGGAFTLNKTNTIGVGGFVRPQSAIATMGEGGGGEGGGANYLARGGGQGGGLSAGAPGSSSSSVGLPRLAPTATNSNNTVSMVGGVAPQLTPDGRGRQSTSSPSVPTSGGSGNEHKRREAAGISSTIPSNRYTIKRNVSSASAAQTLARKPGIAAAIASVVSSSSSLSSPPPPPLLTSIHSSAPSLSLPVKKEDMLPPPRTSSPKKASASASAGALSSEAVAHVEQPFLPRAGGGGGGLIRPQVVKPSASATALGATTVLGDGPVNVRETGPRQKAEEERKKLPSIPFPSESNTNTSTPLRHVPRPPTAAESHYRSFMDQHQQQEKEKEHQQLQQNEPENRAAEDVEGETKRGKEEVEEEKGRPANVKVYKRSASTHVSSRRASFDGSRDLKANVSTGVRDHDDVTSSSLATTTQEREGKKVGGADRGHAQTAVSGEANNDNNKSNTTSSSSSCAVISSTAPPRLGGSSSLYNNTVVCANVAASLHSTTTSTTHTHTLGSPQSITLRSSSASVSVPNQPPVPLPLVPPSPQPAPPSSTPERFLRKQHDGTRTTSPSRQQSEEDSTPQVPAGPNHPQAASAFNRVGPVAPVQQVQKYSSATATANNPIIIPAASEDPSLTALRDPTSGELPSTRALYDAARLAAKGPQYCKRNTATGDDHASIDKNKTQKLQGTSSNSVGTAGTTTPPAASSAAASRLPYEMLIPEPIAYGLDSPTQLTVSEESSTTAINTKVADAKVVVSNAVNDAGRINEQTPGDDQHQNTGTDTNNVGGQQQKQQQEPSKKPQLNHPFLEAGALAQPAAEIFAPPPPPPSDSPNGTNTTNSSSPSSPFGTEYRHSRRETNAFASTSFLTQQHDQSDPNKNNKDKKKKEKEENERIEEEDTIEPNIRKGEEQGRETVRGFNREEDRHQEGKETSESKETATLNILQQQRHQQSLPQVTNSSTIVAEDGKVVRHLSSPLKGTEESDASATDGGTTRTLASTTTSVSVSHFHHHHQKREKGAAPAPFNEGEPLTEAVDDCGKAHHPSYGLRVATFQFKMNHSAAAIANLVPLAQSYHYFSNNANGGSHHSSSMTNSGNQTNEGLQQPQQQGTNNNNNNNNNNGSVADGDDKLMLTQVRQEVSSNSTSSPLGGASVSTAPLAAVSTNNNINTSTTNSSTKSSPKSRATRTPSTMPPGAGGSSSNVNVNVHVGGTTTSPPPLASPHPKRPHYLLGNEKALLAAGGGGAFYNDGLNSTTASRYGGGGGSNSSTSRPPTAVPFFSSNASVNQSNTQGYLSPMGTGGVGSGGGGFSAYFSSVSSMSIVPSPSATLAPLTSQIRQQQQQQQHSSLSPADAATTATATGEQAVSSADNTNGKRTGEPDTEEERSKAGGADNNNDDSSSLSYSSPTLHDKNQVLVPLAHPILGTDLLPAGTTYTHALGLAGIPFGIGGSSGSASPKGGAGRGGGLATTSASQAGVGMGNVAAASATRECFVSLSERRPKTKKEKAIAKLLDFAEAYVRGRNNSTNSKATEGGNQEQRQKEAPLKRHEDDDNRNGGKISSFACLRHDTYSSAQHLKKGEGQEATAVADTDSLSTRRDPFDLTTFPSVLLYGPLPTHPSLLPSSAKASPLHPAPSHSSPSLVSNQTQAQTVMMMADTSPRATTQSNNAHTGDNENNGGTGTTNDVAATTANLFNHSASFVSFVSGSKHQQQQPHQQQHQIHQHQHQHQRRSSSASPKSSPLRSSSSPRTTGAGPGGFNNSSSSTPFSGGLPPTAPTRANSQQILLTQQQQPQQATPNRHQQLISGHPTDVVLRPDSPLNANCRSGVGVMAAESASAGGGSGTNNNAGGSSSLGSAIVPPIVPSMGGLIVCHPALARALLVNGSNPSQQQQQRKGTSLAGSSPTTRSSSSPTTGLPVRNYNSGGGGGGVAPVSRTASFPFPPPRSSSTPMSLSPPSVSTSAANTREGELVPATLPPIANAHTGTVVVPFECMRDFRLNRVLLSDLMPPTAKKTAARRRGEQRASTLASKKKDQPQQKTSVSQNAKERKAPSLLQGVLANADTDISVSHPHFLTDPRLGCDPTLKSSHWNNAIYIDAVINTLKARQCRTCTPRRSGKEENNKNGREGGAEEDEEVNADANLRTPREREHYDGADTNANSLTNYNYNNNSCSFGQGLMANSLNSTASAAAAQHQQLPPPPPPPAVAAAGSRAGSSSEGIPSMPQSLDVSQNRPPLVTPAAVAKAGTGGFKPVDASTNNNTFTTHAANANVNTRSASMSYAGAAGRASSPPSASRRTDSPSVLRLSSHVDGAAGYGCIQWPAQSRTRILTSPRGGTSDENITRESKNTSSVGNVTMNSTNNASIPIIRVPQLLHSPATQFSQLPPLSSSGPNSRSSSAPHNINSNTTANSKGTKQRSETAHATATELPTGGPADERGRGLRGHQTSSSSLLQQGGEDRHLQPFQHQHRPLRQRLDEQTKLISKIMHQTRDSATDRVGAYLAAAGAPMRVIREMANKENKQQEKWRSGQSRLIESAAEKSEEKEKEKDTTHNSAEDVEKEKRNRQAPTMSGELSAGLVSSQPSTPRRRRTAADLNEDATSEEGEEEDAHVMEELLEDVYVDVLEIDFVPPSFVWSTAVTPESSTIPTICPPPAIGSEAALSSGVTNGTVSSSSALTSPRKFSTSATPKTGGVRSNSSSSSLKNQPASAGGAALSTNSSGTYTYKGEANSQHGVGTTKVASSHQGRATSALGGNSALNPSFYLGLPSSVDMCIWSSSSLPPRSRSSPSPRSSSPPNTIKATAAGEKRASDRGGGEDDDDEDDEDTLFNIPVASITSSNGAENLLTQSPSQQRKRSQRGPSSPSANNTGHQGLESTHPFLPATSSTHPFIESLINNGKTTQKASTNTNSTPKGAKSKSTAATTSIQEGVYRPNGHAFALSHGPFAAAAAASPTRGVFSDVPPCLLDPSTGLHLRAALMSQTVLQSIQQQEARETLADQTLSDALLAADPEEVLSSLLAAKASSAVATARARALFLKLRENVLNGSDLLTVSDCESDASYSSGAEKGGGDNERSSNEEDKKEEGLEAYDLLFNALFSSSSEKKEEVLGTLGTTVQSAALPPLLKLRIFSSRARDLHHQLSQHVLKNSQLVTVGQHNTNVLPSASPRMIDIYPMTTKSASGEFEEEETNAAAQRRKSKSRSRGSGRGGGGSGGFSTPRTPPSTSQPDGLLRPRHETAAMDDQSSLCVNNSPNMTQLPAVVMSSSANTGSYPFATTENNTYINMIRGAYFSRGSGTDVNNSSVNSTHGGAGGVEREGGVAAATNNLNQQQNPRSRLLTRNMSSSDQLQHNAPTHHPSFPDKGTAAQSSSAATAFSQPHPPPYPPNVVSVASYVGGLQPPPPQPPSSTSSSSLPLQQVRAMASASLPHLQYATPMGSAHNILSLGGRGGGGGTLSTNNLHGGINSTTTNTNNKSTVVTTTASASVNPSGFYPAGIAPNVLAAASAASAINVSAPQTAIPNPNNVIINHSYAAAVATGIKTLTIVHFNDVYNLDTQGAPDSRGVVGGAARFHTVLERIREYDHPLVLFSGDFIAPSLMSVEMKGRHMVDAFNLFGVHYGTWGNHEFDYGKKALADAIHGYAHGPHVYAGSNSKWIATNMFEGPTYRNSEGGGSDGNKKSSSSAVGEDTKKGEDDEAFAGGSVGKNAPNKLRPIAGAQRKELFIWNGVTVGIMGISENWLPSCAMLAPTDWIYEDMFTVAEETAQELRADGAEVVLCLSHSRISNDKELMRRCPSVDLLLGGHDHFYRCVPNLRIVKGGAEFQFLTEIRIELSASGLLTHNLTSTADTVTSVVPRSAGTGDTSGDNSSLGGNNSTAMMLAEAERRTPRNVHPSAYYFLGEGEVGGSVTNENNNNNAFQNLKPVSPLANSVSNSSMPLNATISGAMSTNNIPYYLGSSVAVPAAAGAPISTVGNTPNTANNRGESGLLAGSSSRQLTTLTFGSNLTDGSSLWTTTNGAFISSNNNKTMAPDTGRSTAEGGVGGASLHQLQTAAFSLGGGGALSMFHPHQMSVVGAGPNNASTTLQATADDSNNNNNNTIANNVCVVSQRRNTIYGAQKGLDASELLNGRQRHQVMNIQIFCHPITVDIPENPLSQKLVSKYNQKLGERMDGVIGKTLVELDPREQTCRFKEGILTGFVCDVIVHELRRLKYAADFALLGGAAFSGKAVIPAGDLKVGDVFSCFPNDTRIMCLRMPGEIVIKTLNAMVKEMPAEAPSFPHCSGDLKFVINLFKRPPQVEDVRVRGKPIGLRKEYIVGLETFAGLGKAKYKFIPPNSTTLLDEENAAQLVHWLIAYFMDKQGQKAEAEAVAAIEEAKKKKKPESGSCSSGEETDHNNKGKQGTGPSSTIVTTPKNKKKRNEGNRSHLAGGDGGMASPLANNPDSVATTHRHSSGKKQQRRRGKNGRIIRSSIGGNGGGSKPRRPSDPFDDDDDDEGNSEDELADTGGGGRGEKAGSVNNSLVLAADSNSRTPSRTAAGDRASQHSAEGRKASGGAALISNINSTQRRAQSKWLFDPMFTPIGNFKFSDVINSLDKKLTLKMLVSSQQLADLPAEEMVPVGAVLAENPQHLGYVVPASVVASQLFFGNSGVGGGVVVPPNAPTAATIAQIWDTIAAAGGSPQQQQQQVNNHSTTGNNTLSTLLSAMQNSALLGATASSWMMNNTNASSTSGTVMSNAHASAVLPPLAPSPSPPLAPQALPGAVQSQPQQHLLLMPPSQPSSLSSPPPNHSVTYVSQQQQQALRSIASPSSQQQQQQLASAASSSACAVFIVSPVSSVSPHSQQSQFHASASGGGGGEQHFSQTTTLTNGNNSSQLPPPVYKSPLVAEEREEGQQKRDLVSKTAHAAAAAAAVNQLSQRQSDEEKKRDEMGLGARASISTHPHGVLAAHAAAAAASQLILSSLGGGGGGAFSINSGGNLTLNGKESILVPTTTSTNTSGGVQFLNSQGFSMSQNQNGSGRGLGTTSTSATTTSTNNTTATNVTHASSQSYCSNVPVGTAASTLNFGAASVSAGSIAQHQGLPIMHPLSSLGGGAQGASSVSVSATTTNATGSAATAFSRSSSPAATVGSQNVAGGPHGGFSAAPPPTAGVPSVMNQYLLNSLGAGAAAAVAGSSTFTDATGGGGSHFSATVNSATAAPMGPYAVVLAELQQQQQQQQQQQRQQRNSTLLLNRGTSIIGGANISRLAGSNVAAAATFNNNASFASAAVNILNALPTTASARNAAAAAAGGGSPQATSVLSSTAQAPPRVGANGALLIPLQPTLAPHMAATAGVQLISRPPSMSRRLYSILNRQTETRLEQVVRSIVPCQWVRVYVLDRDSKTLQRLPSIAGGLTSIPLDAVSAAAVCAVHKVCLNIKNMRKAREKLIFNDAYDFVEPVPTGVFSDNNNTNNHATSFYESFQNRVNTSAHAAVGSVSNMSPSSPMGVEYPLTTTTTTSTRAGPTGKTVAFAPEIDRPQSSHFTGQLTSPTMVHTSSPAAPSEAGAAFSAALAAAAALQLAPSASAFGSVLAGDASPLLMTSQNNDNNKELTPSNPPLQLALPAAASAPLAFLPPAVLPYATAPSTAAAAANDGTNINTNNNTTHNNNSTNTNNNNTNNSISTTISNSPSTPHSGRGERLSINHNANIAWQGAGEHPHLTAKGIGFGGGGGTGTSGGAPQPTSTPPFTQQHAEVRTFLSVPIMYKGEVIGVLQAINKVDKQFLRIQRQRIMEARRRQIAAARRQKAMAAAQHRNLSQQQLLAAAAGIVLHHGDADGENSAPANAKSMSSKTHRSSFSEERSSQASHQLPFAPQPGRTPRAAAKNPNAPILSMDFVTADENESSDFLSHPDGMGMSIRHPDGHASSATVLEVPAANSITGANNLVNNIDGGVGGPRGGQTLPTKRSGARGQSKKNNNNDNPMRSMADTFDEGLLDDREDAGACDDEGFVRSARKMLLEISSSSDDDDDEEDISEDEDDDDLAELHVFGDAKGRKKKRRKDLLNFEQDDDDEDDDDDVKNIHQGRGGFDAGDLRSLQDLANTHNQTVSESAAVFVVPPKFENDREGDHLVLIARNIASQIHHRIMRRKLERSEAVKVDLIHMAKMLGTASRDDDVKNIIMKIAHIACSVFNCDRASVFLVEKGTLWTVVTGKDGEVVTIRFPIGKGIAGECARTGRLSNIHDAYSCPLFNVNIDKQTGYRTRTILAVPIMAENKVDLVGVLQLINKNDYTVFNQEDVELALNFVDLAGIAIHNSFEIETLRVDSGTAGLQELAPHELNRIAIKGGWRTVREKLSYIISDEFDRKLQEAEEEEKLQQKRQRALERKLKKRLEEAKEKLLTRRRKQKQEQLQQGTDAAGSGREMTANNNNTDTTKTETFNSSSLVIDTHPTSEGTRGSKTLSPADSPAQSLNRRLQPQPPPAHAPRRDQLLHSSAHSASTAGANAAIKPSAWREWRDEDEVSEIELTAAEVRALLVDDRGDPVPTPTLEDIDDDADLSDSQEGRGEGGEEGEDNAEGRRRDGRGNNGFDELHDMMGPMFSDDFEEISHQLAQRDHDEDDDGAGKRQESSDSPHHNEGGPRQATALFGIPENQQYPTSNDNNAATTTNNNIPPSRGLSMSNGLLRKATMGGANKNLNNNNTNNSSAIVTARLTNDIPLPALGALAGANYGDAALVNGVAVGGVGGLLAAAAGFNMANGASSPGGGGGTAGLLPSTSETALLVNASKTNSGDTMLLSGDAHANLPNQTIDGFSGAGGLKRNAASLALANLGQIAAQGLTIEDKNRIITRLLSAHNAHARMQMAIRQGQGGAAQKPTAATAAAVSKSSEALDFKRPPPLIAVTKNTIVGGPTPTPTTTTQHTAARRESTGSGIVRGAGVIDVAHLANANSPTAVPPQDEQQVGALYLQSVQQVSSSSSSSGADIANFNSGNTLQNKQQRRKSTAPSDQLSHERDEQVDDCPEALQHFSTTAVFEPVAMATFAPMGVSSPRSAHAVAASPRGRPSHPTGTRSTDRDVSIPLFPPPLVPAATITSSANPLAAANTNSTFLNDAALPSTLVSSSANTNSTCNKTTSTNTTAAGTHFTSSGASAAAAASDLAARTTSFPVPIPELQLAYPQQQLQPHATTIVNTNTKAYQRRLMNMQTRLENTRVELGQLELKLQKAVQKQKLRNNVYKMTATNNNAHTMNGSNSIPYAAGGGGDYPTSANIFVKAGNGGQHEELLLLFASHLGQLATSVLECDRASIYFLRKGKLVGYRKDPDKSKAMMQLEIGSGVAGKCAQLGQIMNVPNAYKCDFFNRTFDRATGYRTNSILCLPLLSGDGTAVIAVLQLINKDDDRPFDADDEFAASILLSMAVDVLRRYFTLEMYVLEVPVAQNV